MNILVLSNGHGEDVVGSRVIRELSKDTSHKIIIVPLVGSGRPYKRLKVKNIKIIKASKQMPSGGFLFLDWRWIQADIMSGLIQQIAKQIRITVKLSRRSSMIVCVGDLYPLLLAYITGKKFMYINTKKSSQMFNSQKTLRSVLPKVRGTNWNFLELFIAKSRKCKVICTRDDITKKDLEKIGVNTVAANPMLSGFYCPIKKPFQNQNIPLIMCLPGSRAPELENNFAKLLKIISNYSKEWGKLILFIPITNTKAKLRIQDIINSFHLDSFKIVDNINNVDLSKRLNCVCEVGQFRKWVGFCDVSLAMAGTASEQCVAMGIPVIALEGNGPQYTKKFARRQKHLLGDALLLSKTVEEARIFLLNILRDPHGTEWLRDAGVERMKCDGGSREIAEYIAKLTKIKA